MNFEEKLKEFISRIQKLKENICTEEATKTAIIMPFFQLMGYDVFNPNEFVPEYIADVGIKKGEKVDYAIVLNDKVAILIEAKSICENIEKHDSQLFRYFGTSSAKFAILTNGVIYNFYTDLEEKNKMDTTPFLQINLLDLKDNEINELKKFCKENFNIESIVMTASDLKYLNSIKNILKREFNNPSDEFTKLILNEGIYEGVKTQSVIEKYRGILKSSINYYINELINERLQNALKSSSGANDSYNENESNLLQDNPDNSGIITTMDELECYYIVKSILCEIIEPEKIFYKDTYSYFAILMDNKVTRWICRIFIKENLKYIIILNDKKEEIRYDINKYTDLYKYKEKLIDRLNCLIENI